MEKELEDSSAEAKTKQMDLLDELVRFRATLYFDLSHGLRTPLTAIRGFTELLLEIPELDEIQREGLQVILRNELRLERVIRQIESSLAELGYNQKQGCAQTGKMTVTKDVMEEDENEDK